MTTNLGALRTYQNSALNADRGSVPRSWGRILGAPTYHRAACDYWNTWGVNYASRIERYYGRL